MNKDCSWVATNYIHGLIEMNELRFMSYNHNIIITISVFDLQSLKENFTNPGFMAFRTVGVDIFVISAYSTNDLVESTEIFV